ncbi:C40 family peptidase [Neisseria mucosa]|uniref:C40 family peptidase n=1 Tax=Neisseria mucosa TaxID=488 RepID=UPI0035564041
MKALSRLAALLVSACMLSGIHFANADDLDSFVKNRQQVLNQFEDAKQPAPAQAPQINFQPARVATPVVHSIPSASAAPVRASRSSDSADELIGSAMGLLGVAYRYGGTSASTGFDCSGFMQHIFRRSMGLNLPRTSAEQAKMGVGISRGELQPGDMVFFRTMGRGRISHVGLYIGNDRFIHAPRTGKRIEITSLSNKYWNAKYAFARRVKKNDPSRFLN